MGISTEIGRRWGVGRARLGRLWAMVAIVFAAPLSFAVAQGGGQTILSSGANPVGAQTVLREIVDPATGDHWLLVRDPERAGAPGRMVLIPGNTREQEGTTVAAGNPSLMPLLPNLKPIIRNGDRVVVEESTPVLDARFEGVALGPAVEGAELSVRLKVSGGVVRVRALAPGRVEVVRAEGGER